MGFMDYTWTLRAENREPVTDTSRIGRVFAIFGESTLKCQEPTPGMYKYKLALSRTLRETLAQSPGSDLALDGKSMDTDAMRSLRQSLLSGGFITLTVDRAPALSCRQGASGAYRALTEGREYACTAIQDMKETQPPSCERPWLDALETLTRHLLLQSKLEGWGFTLPNTDGLRNAVGVFTQGMRVMSDYNNELLDAEFRHTSLQYTSEEYFRRDGLTLVEVDLSKYSRKICGGDHPRIICTEGVALSHALLSLCGMTYASLTRLRHPVYDHVQLGFGNTVFDPTPDERSDSEKRGNRSVLLQDGEIVTNPDGIRISRSHTFVEQKELIMLGTPHPTR